VTVAGGVEGVSATSPGGSVSVKGGLIKMPQFRYIQWYRMGWAFFLEGFLSTLRWGAGRIRQEGRKGTPPTRQVKSNALAESLIPLCPVVSPPTMQLPHRFLMRSGQRSCSISNHLLTWTTSPTHFLPSYVSWQKAVETEKKVNNR
jgi:hypothetical protein